MMKKIIFIYIYSISILGLNAQTADLLSGCAPLEVNFTGPAQANYFWVFDDGGFSDQANPSHIFDASGEYTVELFDSEGGTKVGDLQIIVYAQPIFMISADEQSGCTPFQVKFTNESTVDPNVNITGYLWDFGDGFSSNQENPTHTYTTEGTFDVTLKIESDEAGCTQTMTFPNFIQTSGSISAGFSVSQFVACEAPLTIEMTNNTVDAAGYTYAWDFGNGQTSDKYNPDSPTYTEEGEFIITLVIDNGDGCTVTLSRIIRIGKPQIDISVADTFCIDRNTQIINNSQANSFQWSFGAGANPVTSTLRNPVVRYSTPGLKNVTFTAFADSECKSDSIFTIFVEDPSAAFVIDPMISCFEPATYNFTPQNLTYKDYIYTIEEPMEVIDQGAEVAYIYTPPPRDSFYINRSDTFVVFLAIETHAGCFALDSTTFLHRAPQAHFIPNVSRGCAPLTVSFTEDSKSHVPITSWSWIFGDGDVVNTNMSEDMTHTYTEPGEYYVKIAVENQDGCQDTSAGIYIYVGEPLTSDFTIDKTEICLYESIQMEVTDLDPRIDAYHFNTDEGRIGDCYRDSIGDHTFIHTPGEFPVTLELEYNGCFSTVDNGTTVTVNGTKSRIKYMTNCEAPLTVMLQDSSVNASSSIWMLNGDTINMDTIPTESFNYTFDSTGNYNVYLVTSDGSACAPDTSKVELFIRQITAEFDLPEFVCANTSYDLNASASIDVDNSCSKGYVWYGVKRRPRTLDVPEVEAAWAPGPFQVSLITEDVNGCTDTLTRESTALELNSNFTPDQDIVCYPSQVSFSDLSTGDTTIVAWSWSFGSNQQNPTDLFASGPDDFLQIELVIEDAIGCKDSITKSIEVYKPFTDVAFDPEQIVCIGETINFTATDYNEQGSFLDFKWNFGGQGSSDEQNPSFQVNEVGITTISLIVTEDASGCTNEQLINIQGIAIPEAEIGLDMTEFCINDNIVEFANNSVIDGPGGFFWDFGNGVTTSTGTSPNGSGPNTTSTYDVGTYNITLTASSIYGCSDSDTKTITVTAPMGRFITSDLDNKICANDAVTFTMLDTVDVKEYIWDFGDGTTVENQNPVTHTFGFYPPSGMYDVKLKLISDNDCQISVSIPVEAFNVVADIFPDDDFCAGTIDFFNPADSSDLQLTYDWDFGNGQTSSDPAPAVDYTDAGEYIVSLSVSNDESGCSDDLQDTLTIFPNPVLSIPDSLICEGDSIYVLIENFNSSYDYFVEPNTTGVDTLNSDIILVDPQESLTYTITAIDEMGCISETEITIDFLVTVEVPNLFSPNNDDNNDFFDLIVPDKFREFVEPTIFKVYNRWGNLMYDNENPDVGWDGRLSNGEYAPAEVYTYLIDVAYTNGNSETFKGTVTLIK